MRSFRLTLPQLWQVIAVLLPVLASLATPVSTVDLAYHVRAGGQFLDSGRIPLSDTFTFTAAGEPWLNQQWFAQVVFAAIYRLGGWEALAVLRAALIGIVFAAVLRACRSSGAGPRAASVLTLVAFLVSLVALALRPQLLAMVLFAGVLVIVVERHEHPRRLWALPILAIVWANVHGTFVLLPLLLGVAWLEDVLTREADAARLVRVALATLAATLVNPFGLGVWQYAIGLTTNPSVTTRISEWRPTSIRSVLGLLFYGSALGIVGYLARRGRPTPPATLVWLALLFAVGAMAERGVAWWALGAAVAVGGLLRQGERLPSASANRRIRASRANALTAAALVVLSVAALPWWRPASPVTGRDGLLAYAPSDLTTALRGLAGPQDRIFNPQPWGSWFELAVPSSPVFVDSRIELFDTLVWDDYAAVAGGSAGWHDVLARRGVTIVVADQRRDAQFVGLVAGDPGWRQVYADEDGAIFVAAAP